MATTGEEAIPGLEARFRDPLADGLVKPTIREGWVHWRDARLGPLVWY
jgi:hypothetical protein